MFTGAHVITDDEFWLTDYVMFRKKGRRNVSKYRTAYTSMRITTMRDADYGDVLWFKLVTGNQKDTVGIVYCRPKT